MSVEDLILHFEYDENREKQFYIPGETIRGTILLHLRMGLRVRSMSLLILGGAAVSWEVQGKVKMYSAREEYLQGNVVLEPEDGSATTITSEPFMVLRRPPLPPHTFSDWEMKKSKSLFGLCTTGQIKLYCRISRTAAIPGEVIYVNAEVSNWSPRGITLIQAAVIMESTYHARNTDSKNNKIVFRQILNKRLDVFDVVTLRGRRAWRVVLDAVFLRLAVPPYLADSGLEECSIIDVKYLFEFRVQIEGRDDLVVQTPLYVGGHPIGYMNESARGYRRMDLDGFSLANNELPWYGGGMGTMSETVDGDFFDLR
nr:hypothetical protein BaRGS_012627 [Batillaria attramentaria]